MFGVVIQLGAILAVVVLYWSRLVPFGKGKTDAEKRTTWRLWGRVLIASLPAAFVGIVLDKILEKATGKDIDGWFYNSIVVAAALIVYGIAFIIIERKNKQKTPHVSQIEEISIKNALAIGAFQALSIIPGTSRSGSTILGSMLVGISRTAAAEFSFFMAIPVMVGASGIKALGFLSYVSESAVAVPTMAWVALLVGCAVSFAVSMAAIRFLMDFVKKHSFAPFGIYRIALGILVLILGLIRG
jgi:undecaprenyl-diphosphatase